MAVVHRPRFSADEFGQANELWGANCGPGAIAVMCGLTLDETRVHLGEFEQKHYTNPTLMFQTLDRIGIGWSKSSLEWPTYGLCRVQWEGPWTQPGVPLRARYRHTHWIGAADAGVLEYGVFDINALQNGSGWVTRLDWRTKVAPWIIEHCVPRASGEWHLTHVLELDRSFADARQSITLP